HFSCSRSYVRSHGDRAGGCWRPRGTQPNPIQKTHSRTSLSVTFDATKLNQATGTGFAPFAALPTLEVLSVRTAFGAATDPDPLPPFMAFAVLEPLPPFVAGAAATTGFSTLAGAGAAFFSAASATSRWPRTVAPSSIARRGETPSPSQRPVPPIKIRSLARRLPFRFPRTIISRAWM